MSNGHGSSRRQAYGRRMKDLRTRRGDTPDVDLDGPAGWTRGADWEDEQTLRHIPFDADPGERSPRPR
jgi:hypothetical protein